MSGLTNKSASLMQAVSHKGKPKSKLIQEKKIFYHQLTLPKSSKSKSITTITQYGVAKNIKPPY
jgi:hypothetical protein